LSAAGHQAQQAFLSNGDGVQALPTLITSSAHPVSVYSGPIPAVSYTNTQSAPGKIAQSITLIPSKNLLKIF
jgi:hypothetical protein